MKFARGANAATWAVKVWYCDAGEPPASVSATIKGMELSGDDGVFHATIELGGALKAKFKYPPPNDDVQEGTFQKLRK